MIKILLNVFSKFIGTKNLKGKSNAILLGSTLSVGLASILELLGFLPKGISDELANINDDWQLYALGLVIGALNYKYITKIILWFKAYFVTDYQKEIEATKLKIELQKQKKKLKRGKK